MAGKGAGNLYYLHRAPPRVEVEAPEDSRVRMRICKTALPIFEGLAEAGSQMREPESVRAALAGKVESFKRGSAAALEEAIDAHARRFHSGFYKYDDPGNLAQKRHIGILSVAIYLTEAVDIMWERLGQRDDAGSSALFETTLDSISAMLGPGYYQKTSGDVGLELAQIKDILDSTLNVLGLPGRIMDVWKIVETNVPELIERTTEHFRRIQE